MFGISKNDSVVTYGVVIDVGSGSVGTGILKSDRTKKTAEVLFSNRVYMRGTGEKNDSGDAVRRMKEALFSASLTLSKEGLQALTASNKNAKVSRILVTCSSPWSHTISRNVNYHTEEEFKISETLINDLITTAEEEIENELSKTAIVGSMGLQVVERATVNIKINDYTIHSPIGLRGKELSLSHITGLIPKEIIESVHEVQEKILTDTTISAHTYLLVAYCVYRDLFPKLDTFTIVDVTGESTEIGIVQDGVLLDVRHTNYGSNTVIREIAEKTKSSPEEVISMLRSLTEMTTSEEQQTKISNLLLPYAESITKAIHELQETRSIPNTLIITALPQLKNLFDLAIPEIASAATNSEYTILELKNLVDNEIATKYNDDIFITIASRFFHKLHGCGEIESA